MGVPVKHLLFFRELLSGDFFIIGVKMIFVGIKAVSISVLHTVNQFHIIFR